MATPSLLSPTAAHTIEHIEAFVLDVIARIQNEEDPCAAARGALPGLCASAKSTGGAASSTGGGFTGARDLAGMLRVMSTSYELLLKGKTLHNRQVYYLHKQQFAHEKEAQAAIDRVAQLLEVPRHDLGVFAASRGWYDGLVFERTAAAPSGSAAIAGTRRPIRPGESRVALE